MACEICTRARAALDGALAGGAVLGAIHGVVRVEQGWRVRLVFGCDQQPLLEVRRVS